MERRFTKWHQRALEVAAVLRGYYAGGYRYFRRSTGRKAYVMGAANPGVAWGIYVELPWALHRQLMEAGMDLGLWAKANDLGVFRALKGIERAGDD